MCYAIVQINFDVQAIPDDKLADPENKTTADYGTRDVFGFTFPAEFLAEIALEQMFLDYERVKSGNFEGMTPKDIEVVERMFEYPVGLVQVHTGELTLYRDAPRPDLGAFETSEDTKLTYGLADLRIADPNYGSPVVVHDRLDAAQGLMYVGLSADQLALMADGYVGVAMNPESSSEDLDKATETIAEVIKTAIDSALGEGVAFVGTERDGVVSPITPDEPDEPNPFGGLKLRG